MHVCAYVYPSLHKTLAKMNSRFLSESQLQWSIQLYQKALVMVLMDEHSIVPFLITTVLSKEIHRGRMLRTLVRVLVKEPRLAIIRFLYFKLA